MVSSWWFTISIPVLFQLSGTLFLYGYNTSATDEWPWLMIIFSMWIIPQLYSFSGYNTFLNNCVFSFIIQN